MIWDNYDIHEFLGRAAERGFAIEVSRKEFPGTVLWSVTASTFDGTEHESHSVATKGLNESLYKLEHCMIKSSFLNVGGNCPCSGCATQRVKDLED